MDGRTGGQPDNIMPSAAGEQRHTNDFHMVTKLNLFLEHSKDSATRLLILVNIDTSATLDNLKYSVLVCDIILCD